MSPLVDKSVKQFDRAGERITDALRGVINDGEELLRASAKVSDEGFALVRDKFEQKLLEVRRMLAAAAQPAIASARQAAEVTDEYVHGNPWTAVGVGTAAGVLLGFLLSRRR